MMQEGAGAGDVRGGKPPAGGDRGPGSQGETCEERRKTLSSSRKRGRDRCADKAIQYVRVSSVKTPEVLERKCKDFEDIQNRSSNQ